jgi:hypothetical protein
MKDSGAINARYQGLKAEMDVFVGSFGNFAATQEDSLNQKITDINKEITALTKEIGDKKIAMYVLLGVAGAALPVSGVIAAFCGPAAPAVLVSILHVQYWPVKDNSSFAAYWRNCCRSDSDYCRYIGLCH